MNRSVALSVGLVAIGALTWFFARDQLRLDASDAATTPVSASLLAAPLVSTPDQALPASSADAVPTGPGGLQRTSRPGEAEAIAEPADGVLTTVLAPLRALIEPDSPLPRPLAYVLLAAMLGFFVGWVHRALRPNGHAHAALTGEHPDHVDPAKVADQRVARRLRDLEKQLGV